MSSLFQPRLSRFPKAGGLNLGAISFESQFSRGGVPRYKTIFGFVGSMTDTASLDTLTPVQLQIVAKLAFRYGNTPAEWKDSFVLVRINAFNSRAYLGKCFSSVTMGTPVMGVIQGTKSDKHSAQLVG